MFSEKVQNARVGYTFDDFLLTPNGSYVEPKNVDTTVKINDDISLNIPILSAAMDTVTESELAIALAQEGGIGVIHRNKTLEQEVEEVKKVKNADDITISDVITINPDSSVSEVQKVMDDMSISGLPVVEGEDIIGIISRRDVKPIIKSGQDKLVKDIMTSDVVTIDESISAEEALDIAYENKVERLPVLSDNKLVGIVTIRDILNHKKHANAARDKEGRLLVAAATQVQILFL